MTEQDLQLLCQWIRENGDHKISWLEKEAVKIALNKAGTVNDLMETALKALGKK